MDILSKAKSIVSQYDDIMKQMVDPENVLNQEKMAVLAKEKSNLDEAFELSKSYISLKKQLQELSELKNDKEYENSLWQIRAYNHTLLIAIGKLNTDFETDGIYNLMKSILNNFKKIEDISLQELYNLSNIKLTVKVFNATKKQLEYISHETNPNLSVLTLAQMTTAIPFVFKPVKYRGDLYVDGGLRGHFPIEKCQSKNYLGLFIQGGSYPEDSPILKLFPILDFIYSLMIQQDQVIYDIKKNEIDPKIIYIPVDYGLKFDMSNKEKIEIMDKSYRITIEHIKQHLVKDIT